MIQLNGLNKSYAKGQVKAVNDLNLHVKSGELFGFIGPNGAGKTTTIKMMCGMLTPDSGEVMINGSDMLKNPVETKKRIGYVPDSQFIYDRLTGLEYIKFIADVYQVDEETRISRTEQFLKMFELEKAANDPIKSYSHGMKQKIVITGALIHNPPLWLLDEPMVGLDPKSAHILKQLMRQHCDGGNTVFFSTHVLEVAEKLCDRIGVISGGKLIAVGTLDELRSGSDQSLENIFLGLTEEGGASL